MRQCPPKAIREIRIMKTRPDQRQVKQNVAFCSNGYNDQPWEHLYVTVLIPMSPGNAMGSPRT